MPYFHSSPQSTIEGFAPFSHFGTYASAISNAGRKVVEAREQCLLEPDQPLDFYLYEVDWDIQPNQVLKLADWGTPKAMGLAYELANLFENQPPYDAFEKIRRYLGDLKSTGTDPDFAGFPLLAAELHKHGISVLEYSNIVEGGQSKDVCYCVIAPRIINKKPPLLISASEVDAAVKAYCEEYRRV